MSQSLHNQKMDRGCRFLEGESVQQLILDLQHRNKELEKKVEELTLVVANRANRDRTFVNKKRQTIHFERMKELEAENNGLKKQI